MYDWNKKYDSKSGPRGNKMLKHRKEKGDTKRYQILMFKKMTHRFKKYQKKFKLRRGKGEAKNDYLCIDIDQQIFEISFLRYPKVALALWARSVLHHK